MIKNLIHISDLSNASTWMRYRDTLCLDCLSACCTLATEVKVSDLVRMGVVDAFEAEGPAKAIAKRLLKAGVIEHFNFKNELYTLARRPNNDCIYLDTQSRLCTIYEKRPNTCRNHPHVGPRSGYCAYIRK